jgi:rhamnosyltransferase
MKNKLFIIVLYNCQLANSKSYISIINSLKLEDEKAGLFIYDNSPDAQIIADDPTNWSEIKYIHDKNNSGLGVAYNTGAEFGRRNGYQWIGLIDQDTEFASDYIRKINGAQKTYPTIKLFAPMLRLKNGEPFSPIKFRNRQWSTILLPAGIYSLFKYCPVNSGIIIHIAAYSKVGGYVNEIRLDFADFQFIERYKIHFADFCLLDSIGIQDFSNNEPDVNKAVSRFKIYLDCAFRCTRKSIMDDMFYLYIVSRHALALTYRFKTKRFITLLYTDYLKHRK